MNRDDRPKPLNADPRRQAVPSIRGYGYQLWSSVHAWLELRNDQVLFLEGAEDFDVVGRDDATANQVKTSLAAITLRTPDVVDTIKNFWRLRADNEGRVVSLRFLTTSRFAIEQGYPFGENMAGLAFWNRAQSDPSLIPSLANFVATLPGLNPSLVTFLSECGDTDEIRKTLVQPITWVTRAGGVRHVKRAIQRKLAALGQEREVPAGETAAVADRLFTEVLDTITDTADRSLDRSRLLIIFDEATAHPVPAGELRRLHAIAARVAIGELAPISDPPARFEPATSIVLSLPPIPAWADTRREIVDELRRQLSAHHLLFIRGSVGMGKTTLARLVTSSNSSEWLWVGLSHLPPEQLVGTLTGLVTKIDRDPARINLVLDGIEFGPRASRQLEEIVGGVLFTLAQRRAYALVTTTSEVPGRLIRTLGFSAATVQHAPPFTEPEIRRLAAALGCPKDERLDHWPRVLLLHTQGHPTLVHAGLLQLQRNGWPSLAHEDLLRPLDDLLREKDGARRLLGGVLHDEERELLYRLSLRRGPFRRDQALYIASGVPSVSRPGDVFDGLVGPWIEDLGDEYYRLSPLIENAGLQAWDPETVAQHQRSIGRAILRAGRLTSEEGVGVLMLGLAAKDGDLVAIVADGLLRSPGDVLKAVGEQHPWLAYIHLEPPQSPFPDHGPAAFMVRHLQFRIAAGLESGVAAKVADAWGAEIVEGESRKLFLGLRLMYAIQVLVRYQVEIPASTALSLLSEIAAIRQEAPDLMPASLSSEASDPFMLLAAFLPARCTGVEFLSELLGALEATSAGVRERFLDALATSMIQSKFLFSQPWLREVDRARPDWDSCRSVLGRAIALAREWHAPVFGGCAAQALAVVLDEYVGQQGEALEALGAALTAFGELPDVRDQQATVLLHQERYGEALTCWDRAFSSWVERLPEEGDVAPMYAYRKAGIAAANLGAWAQARDYFLHGHRAALLAKQATSAAALLGDAAFAAWEAGQRLESVRHLAAAMERIDVAEAKDDEFRTLVARKLIRHVIAWEQQEVTASAGLARPVPGMCSNPERDERFRGLPEPPAALGWAMLADLGMTCGDEQIFERARSQYGTTDCPAARYLLANLSISLELRSGRGAEVLRQAAAMSEAQAQMDLARATGRPIWERPAVRDGAIGALTQFPWGRVLILSLLAERAGGGSGREALLTWRDVTAMQHRPGESWLPEGEVEALLLTVPIGEARVVMKSDQETSTRRLLAAVRVGSDQDVGPEDLFLAHALLVDWIASDAWAGGAGSCLEPLVVRRWEEMIENPSVLLSPRLTVPAIRVACDAAARGITHVAQVLLAAMNAVRIANRSEVAQHLRKYALGA